MNFFLFLHFFHQYTMLSSCTVDGHQVYFGGLVIGKSSTIDRDLVHPSPNIHSGSKNAKFGVVFSVTRESLNFELPTFEHAAGYPNSETKVQCCDYRPMSSPSLVKLGQRTPEKALSVVTHPLKFSGIFG